MALTAISTPVLVPERLISFPRARIKPSAGFYRPELDLLRFFAFLSVFLHHSLPGLDPSHHSGSMAVLSTAMNALTEAASFGVCLFFLLSAYLITELLEKERGRTGNVYVPSFYIRRILRIWPLYFSFLFAGVALGLVFDSYRLSPGRVLAFVLLSGNWYVAATTWGASTIAPLWSISVEEQFYLLWPCIARIGGRAAILGTALFLVPLSWIALFWLSQSHADSGRAIWVNSFVQFQFFAAGGLLALGLKGSAPRLNAIWRLAMILGGLLSWLIAQGVFHIIGEAPPPSFSSLILGYSFVAVGCGLLFLAFLGTPREWHSKRLVYLGKISFGLYVFHMLALDCARKVLLPAGAPSLGRSLVPAVARLLLIQATALGLTVLLAVASYRFLERPFLKLKERFTFIQSRAV